jgi:hypothetical protein
MPEVFLRHEVGSGMPRASRTFSNGPSAGPALRPPWDFTGPLSLTGPLLDRPRPLDFKWLT